MYQFVPLVVFFLFLIINAAFTIKQQTAGIVERFGKFQSIRQSGLQFNPAGSENP